MKSESVRETPKLPRMVKMAVVRLLCSLAMPLAAFPAQGQTYSRTQTFSYYDHPALWVMDQPLQTATNGIEVSSITYNGTTALPVTESSFGIPKRSLTYHAAAVPLGTNGTIATVSDGNGRTTSYGNWKRGIPQNIGYADGTGETAVVDDRGWITSLRDENGFETCYTYDGLGRVKRTTYPTEGSPYGCGEANWLPTTSVFEQVWAVEYGIGAGHWRLTVSTGNAIKVTYYDGMWRPMLTREFDAASEGSTRRMVLRYFDVNGRKVFESYPQASILSVTSTPYGTATSYDALGRVKQTLADSELGWLTTSHAYLSGFQTATTNPRGYTATTTYRAFANPEQAEAMTISAPEGANVSFARDVWGKPTQITRSGGGVSASRWYVYDGNQRLCKTIEPESGATVLDYDGADNIISRAMGTTLTGLTCDRGSAPTNRKISHAYDLRNRLTGTTYGDGSPSAIRTYTPDGLLASVSTSGGSNSIAWAYTYNSLRRLTLERYTWGDPGNGWDFQWGIDANGNVGSLTDPWGTMSYAPNALGQPTQVSGYASGVTYHPNGAVAGYTLANGVNYSMAPNVRGLPGTMAHGNVAQDGYAYDANGNVTAIADQTPGQNGINNRTMPLYDGLDRLRQASGPWGGAAYAYDAIDNLVSSTVGGRSLTHQIDPVTNRLAGITGSQTLSIGYDPNGNVTQRGAQGFVFDVGNRMSAAVGQASYQYDGHGRRNVVLFASGDFMHQAYTQDGKLRFAWRLSQGGGRRHVYLGDKLIAETAPDLVTTALVTTYAHTDALGSPVAVTAGNGTVSSRTRYEPYGGTVAGSIHPTRIGFTGHVNDADTGLVYMQQRYYEPIAGRFLSVDPVVTDTKEAGHFNRYVYADSNPYRYVDPDGRLPRSIVEKEPLGPINAGGAGTRGSGSVWTTRGNTSSQGTAQTSAPGGTVTAPAPTRQQGSYTNGHESGKTYDGKGSKERSQESGRRIEKETGDKHISTEWTPAQTPREAFKQEATRLESHGGPKSPSNYNKIESPGKKMQQQETGSS